MTGKDVGTRIKQVIREQHLKQNEFARTLGISANYVYLLTSGRKTSISEPLAKLIESTYGYSAHWLLTGEGNRLLQDGGQISPMTPALKMLPFKNSSR